MNACPSGVKVFVFNSNSDQPLDIDADGCMGDIPYKSLLIEVVVEPDTEVHGFNVTDNGDVTPARDWRAKPRDEEDPAVGMPAGSRVYRRKVPVVESELHAVLTTKYPNNNIRLLESLGDGYFQLWRVAIVSQDGEFFLTIEKMYTPFRCYRSGVTVVCPTHNGGAKRPGWAPFITFLNRMLLGEAFQSLPPIKEITDERPNGDSPKLNGISEGEGRVVWFSDAEQYGMLMTKLGPARVHWREINRRGSRRRYLQAGELVAFDELAKPHLTKARDTGFKLEAVRVTIKKEKTQ